MAEIIRNRTISPSTRLEKSKSYRVDTKKMSEDDILIVNIDHKKKPFQNSYSFKGTKIAHKNSIHFRAIETGNLIDIIWSNGIQPE